MIRLRFGVNDLARTVFAPPFLLCEVAGSIEAIQRPGSAFWSDWRTTRLHVPTKARTLLSLVPAHGGVPEFLAPEHDGSLDELLDLVGRTPAPRFAADLAETRHPGSRAAWVHDLAAGRSGAVTTLVQALRCWHDHVVAPMWSRLQPVVAAELSRRAWQWTVKGAEPTMNSLHPGIRWRDGILEVEADRDADIDLAGRGLRLVPSAIWSRPVLATGWAQPSLTYPVPRSGRATRSAIADTTDGLAALMGSTRARVLRRLAASDHTTSGLASALGVSLASASTHAAALRDAGLVNTHREGRTVRHELTRLGHLLVSTTPAGPPRSARRRHGPAPGDPSSARRRERIAGR